MVAPPMSAANIYLMAGTRPVGAGPSRDGSNEILAGHRNDRPTAGCLPGGPDHLVVFEVLAETRFVVSAVSPFRIWLDKASQSSEVVSPCQASATGANFQFGAAGTKGVALLAAGR
jgi:hypothetical protein